jgi:PAS domain S-box-containing protein
MSESGEAKPLTLSASHGTDILRLLIDSVQDYAIFLLDETGRILSWNRGARRIKGYTAQEAIGQHFSIFYPEEDLAWNKPGTELAIARKEGRFEEEGWRLRKDGTRFWANVVITALFDQERVLRGFGKVTRDLTERRASEERLRRSEETFRLLVENVVDYGIFQLDQTGHIRTWNAGAERIKGWPANEIIGKHFSVFYPPEDVEAGKPDWELEVAIRDGRLEDEGWRVRKDGSRFWANVIITALYNEAGELRGFGKVTRDLTERRNAELAKDRFIANAAHELRTPLAVVIGLSSHLRNPAAVNDPEFPDYIDAITRQSVRMRSLVNNLLDMAQLDQSRVRTSIEDVSLSEAIEHVLRALPPPEGKHVEVEVEVTIASVQADAEKLDRVLTNLISNAYRYGGDRIEIRAQPQQDMVLLEVSDDGHGIPEELREHLFEPFTRGDARPGIEGSGLGLAIVKGLVESFGGSIELVEDGAGAHFRILLRKGQDG